MNAAIRTWGMGIIISVLLGTGCTAFLEQSAPTPAAPAWHLLIDDTLAFPQEWNVDPCDSSHRLCFGETHALRGFGRVGIPGSVIQDVYRLDSVASAKAMFQRARGVDFKKSSPPRVPSSEFLPPSEITYRSPIADEFYLGCGVDVVPACEAIFRYGNYFVMFFLNVDKGYVDDVEIIGNGLKIEEVEPILRAMDARAAAVLGLRPRAEPTKTP
jgi:hypothetical protein